MNESANNSVTMNTTTTRRYLFLPLDPRTKLAMHIATGVCCSYGIVANSLILYLKTKTKNKERRALKQRPFNRSLMSVFIQSLACCQLLFCVKFSLDVIFNYIDIINSDWLCKIIRYGRIVFPAITLNHLFVMGIERYLSIFHPFIVPSIRTSKVLATTSWIVGGLFVMPASALIILQRQDIGPEHFILTCVLNNSLSIYKLIFILVIILNFIIPNIVLVFLNYAIIKFLRNRSGSNQNGQIDYSQFNNAKAFVALFLVYFLPYCLYIIFPIIRFLILKPRDNFYNNSLFELIGTLLAYLTAAAFPTVMLACVPHLQNSLQDIRNKYFRSGRVDFHSTLAVAFEGNLRIARIVIPVIPELTQITQRAA